MSLKYKDSIFLNADYEVIIITNGKVKDSSVNMEKQKGELTDTNYYEDSNEDFNGVSEFSQIPTKRDPKQTKGAACCRLLQQTKSLIYLVTDEEASKNLQKQLNIIFDELDRLTTTDFGIVKSFEKLAVPKQKKVILNWESWCCK